MSGSTLITFIISSILITMFLFFIDEGFYNFNWMAKWGNWVAFFIYAVPVFLGQLIVYKAIPGKYRGPGSALISIIAGTAIALTFMINIIFSNVN